MYIYNVYVYILNNKHIYHTHIPAVTCIDTVLLDCSNRAYLCSEDVMSMYARKAVRIKSVVMN